MASERPVPTGLEAVALLKAFEAEKKLSPEEVDAGILAIRAQTGQEVTAVATPEAGEKTPDHALTFAQATELLREYGIDLVKERKDNVLCQIRHGRITSDQAAGYDSQFDHVQLSGRDVREVIQTLQQGRKFLVAFQAVQEDPASAFAELGEANIKTREYARVADFSSKESTEEQKGPSVIFTPADLNIPSNMGNRTADDWMQESRKNGMNFVEPSEWCGLFEEALYTGMCALHGKEKIDAMTPDQYKTLCAKTLENENSGIDQYLLDVKTVTFFPGHRNNSGGVLGFDFVPRRGDRRVLADDWDPRIPDPDVGPRIALGRVRSTAKP